MIRPDAQLRAGHRPADLIPPGADPRSVVVVQQMPRSSLGTVVIVLSTAAGTALVIVMIALTIHVTAGLLAAIPSIGVGGLTLKLAGGRK